MIKTIPPHGEIEIKTHAYYLSIINATGSFIIDSPAFGQLVAVTGRKFEIHARGVVPTVDFINDSDQPIDVEFEVSNIPVSGGSSAVNVSNAIVVKRIEEGITSNAVISNIEDGKVRQLASDAINALPVVAINPNETKLVAPANAQTNRLVTLQNVSATRTELWICGSSADKNRGSYFAGSKALPSSEKLTNEAAIYIHNASEEVAHVAVREEFRA